MLIERDNGGQKSAATVMQSDCVKSYVTLPLRGLLPTVKLVHLKKILHYLGYIMAITVLCIIIYIIKFL